MTRIAGVEAALDADGITAVGHGRKLTAEGVSAGGRRVLGEDGQRVPFEDLAAVSATAASASADSFAIPVYDWQYESHAVAYGSQPPDTSSAAT